MLTADDIVAIIRPMKERAGDDAWREAMTRLGGDPVDAADETWPPAHVDERDPDWASVAEAAFEAGKSEKWVRNHRHHLGVPRKTAQGVRWLISRRKLFCFRPGDQ